MKKLNVLSAVVLLLSTLMVTSCEKIDDWFDEGDDCNVITTTWVDLGLPSGLQWASHNVGATSPEEYGDYYAWGEISPSSEYGWLSYRYCYCDGYYYNVTKYCNDSTSGYNGFRDTLTILQPSDDAATVNMGYGARIPTKEEWEELVNNTTQQWTIYNGVYGMCLTGSNGNSIFLPAAGERNSSSLYDAGIYGYYWSSSLYTSGNSCVAWSFNFSDNIWHKCECIGRDRFIGVSVRAVRDSGQK